MSENRNETIEGYVVDTICIRKMAASTYTKQAEEHTTACAIMGHCVESGYCLIGPHNKLVLLDPKATPLIYDLLKATDKKKGVVLRVERKLQNEEMQTVRISVVNEASMEGGLRDAKE